MHNSPTQATQCIQRVREDVKALLYQRMLEEGLTQEYVAFMIGKAQQTVNHYLNPNDQQDLPAYTIPFLPEPLAVELLRFLADRIGHDLLRKIPVKGECNGSTDDEMLNLDVLQGKFIEQLRCGNQSTEKTLRTVAKMKEQLALIEAEIKMQEEFKR